MTTIYKPKSESSKETISVTELINVRIKRIFAIGAEKVTGPEKLQAMQLAKEYGDLVLDLVKPSARNIELNKIQAECLEHILRDGVTFFKDTVPGYGIFELNSEKFIIAATYINGLV
jgi:tRNA U54 and U55 pseudouridine synthase Pus10